MREKIRNQLVSVILPVYNNENTIQKCIESVLGQQNANLELIIVDDGSQDKSQELCRVYEKKDSRVIFQRVMHGGVARARNYGLLHARGEYIMFVDADDFYYDGMVSLMEKAMEKSGADLAVCTYYKKIGNYRIPCTIREKSKLYSVEGYLKNILKDPGHHYYGVVWNKMFRRSVIMNHTLFFDKDAGLGEDFIFNLNYMNCIKKVQVIGKHLYCYDCTKEKSLSRKENKIIQDVWYEYQSRRKIFHAFQETFREKGIYESEKRKIMHYWISFYIRQKYHLKREYLGWRKEDKDTLNDFLEQDEMIQECVREYKGQVCKELVMFFLKQDMKNKIKLILGISKP